MKKISKLGQSTIDSVSNKVTASTLSGIVDDWLRCFPDLKRYRSGQKLLKRIGPVVVGIELEKFLSNAYRPRVVLYNLLDETSNKLIPVIDQTIRSKKGIEISIEYSQHAKEYLPATDLLVSQSRVKLNGKTTLDELLGGIILYIENDAVSNCFWSCQAVMQLSRLIESESKREQYFRQGLDLVKKKVSAQFLDRQTKGVEAWTMSIKNLEPQTMGLMISKNLKKHRLEDVLEF